eukprot:5168895-Amphidinium_carterae.1
MLDFGIDGDSLVALHAECLGAWTLFWKPCRKVASQFKSILDRSRIGLPKEVQTFVNVCLPCSRVSIDLCQHCLGRLL